MTVHEDPRGSLAFGHCRHCRRHTGVVLDHAQLLRVVLRGPPAIPVSLGTHLA